MSNTRSAGEHSDPGEYGWPYRVADSHDEKVTHKPDSILPALDQEAVDTLSMYL